VKEKEPKESESSKPEKVEEDADLDERQGVHNE
jgi:hypothetical protein